MRAPRGKTSRAPAGVHTPGPYSSREGTGRSIYIQAEGRTAPIAFMLDDFERIPREEVEANAALFIAAPELRDLVVQLDAFVRRFVPHPADKYMGGELCQRVQAALGRPRPSRERTGPRPRASA